MFLSLNIAFRHQRYAEISGLMKRREEMKKNLDKTLVIYEQIRDFVERKIGHCRMKMSICTEGEESLGNAFESLRLEEKFQVNHPDENQKLIALYHHQGDAYRKNNDYSKASESYEKSLEVFRKQSDDYKEKNRERREKCESKLIEVCLSQGDEQGECTE